MDVKVEAFKSGCSGGYCFVISDYTNNSEHLDLSTAQQRCQSYGAQLAEIKSRDIQSSTINFIQSQGLNGRNVLTNGKRSSSNWIRLSGNAITGLSVNDQTDASYAYGYLKSSSSGFDPFASRPTDNKGGYICTVGLSDCSGGVTINGQCFKSFTETLSWYEARNRCLNGGGDLASFDHIATNAGFKALNGSWINTQNSYWIGIRRERWTWQNTNSDVKYSDWITGHPLNEVSRPYTDCLCLSTTEWKWTECGCIQQLPFVCISDNNSTASRTTTTSTKTTATTSITAPTTTQSTTSTIRSAITAFTAKDTSKTTSLVTFESNGVSTPTIPTTVTSNSTPAANDTDSLEQSIRLSREATIGIGVGVGVGGAVVIVVLVAVVILCRKRYPLRCPRRKADAKVRPRHIPTQDNDHSNDGMESLYASVVPSSPNHNNADTNALESSNETSTVYAQLGFHKQPSNHRDGSVIIVPGKTKPYPVPRPPATNGATKKCNVSDDMNTGDTMA